MKRWICTVCKYIHEGDAPPEKCPECSVGPEFFDFLDEIEDSKRDSKYSTEDLQNILFKIQCGLFVVAAGNGEKFNGQISNTIFQITSSPLTIAAGINKGNLTHEFLEKAETFSVCLLGSGCSDLVSRFGFQSGRKVEKFTEDLNYFISDNGNPILKDCVAYFEARLLKDKSLDMGTHTLFTAEIIAGDIIKESEQTTYSNYRKEKSAPKKGNENSKQWKCTVCSYIHEGDEPPEKCPVCNVGPEFFELVE